MLPAACSLGFGFLRAAEFMTPSSAAYDPGCHLSLADVALDSHLAPTTIRIAIKQSKTDPYRKGAHIFIGQSFTDICPVQRMVAYLATRGPSQGPLFMHKDGQPLSRSSLVKKGQIGTDPGWGGCVNLQRPQLQSRGSFHRSSKWSMR